MHLDRRVIGVFGANGFIGRALVRRLLKENRRVVAFSRSFSPDFETAVGAPVEKRDVNINDALSIQSMIQDVSHVVQLINSSSPGLANNRVGDDLQSNVVPHVDFIQSCLASNVSSFIFVSSGGTVYGEPEYSPIDERHPLRPISSYGMTKMMVEQYLRMLSLQSGMSAVSLRVSNPFGPGQTLKKGQGLIASILKNHSIGVPTTVFGDGSSERDYLFIEDLMDAFMATLDTPGLREEINIGSGVGRSIRQVLTAVEMALGSPLTVEYGPGRPTDTKVNILDCRKAGALLDWRATTNFDDAIRRTVSAWKTSPGAQVR